MLTVACGGSIRDDAGRADASAGNGGADSGSGGGVGGLTGGSGGDGGGISLGGTSGFAATGGTAGDAGNVTVADAGLFDCYGCACNGATSYCVKASGGFWTPPLPDAGLCSADAGTVHCKPLPDSCQGAPSCGCVPEPHNICDCEDVGGGLMVKCYYP